MGLRESNLQKLPMTPLDVLVIGGGINGVVSAAALSSQGTRVALIDRGDFASFTSEHSSNLVWGGIKYLESFEFALVRRLCKSRNRLITYYPSTVQEIRFLTTIDKGFRHRPLMVWLGAWLYWFIGNCFTETPRFLSPEKIRGEEAVVTVENSAGGVEYSDAYFHDNDARFVFNLVRSALNMGCIAANYVESLGSKRVEGKWITTVKEKIDGAEFEIKSKVLINATGPFVDEYNRLSHQTTQHHHVFSKGIHLIVDQITPNRRVLAFFADDGRLFFVIPMGSKTCIGTTDTPVDHPVTEITDEDRCFVLDNINKHVRLNRPLSVEDIIAERCGVRPLVVRGKGDNDADFLRLSRKHVIECNREDAHISIFGGKLTDCLNIGDEVLSLVRELGVNMPYAGYKWYGEPHAAIRQQFFHQARLMDLDSYTSPESSEKLSVRLWRRYGAQAFGLLENIREDPRQAEVLIKGTEYIRCEISQAARREMVVKLEDFLRRRSKIALLAHKKELAQSAGLIEACEILFGDQAKEKFDEYFQN
jgi:Glycerol-3-phosphate dehydrogenase